MALLLRRYSRGSLQVLNQLKLPHETEYVDVSGAEDAFNVIKSMTVRTKKHSVISHNPANISEIVSWDSLWRPLTCGVAKCCIWVAYYPVKMCCAEGGLDLVLDVRCRWVSTFSYYHLVYRRGFTLTLSFLNRVCEDENTPRSSRGTMLGHDFVQNKMTYDLSVPTRIADTSSLMVLSEISLKTIKSRCCAC